MEIQQGASTVFTIAEAARLYGRDRASVFRDTKKSGGLSARKEQRGNREVAVLDLAELIRFYGEPPKRDEGSAEDRPHDGEKGMGVHLELALMHERLRAAQERQEQLEKERVREASQLAAERDRALEQLEHWRQQAEVQTRLLTDERKAREEAEARGKRRWRLFG